MTLHVKDATTWKEAKPYVRDGGTWKEITNAYVRDGGTWKEFYTSYTPPTYYYTLSASGASGSGTTLDGSWSVDPASGANPWCVFDYYSSDPPGFWYADAGGGGGAYSGTLRSVSKTASPGTTVTLTYQLSFEADPGTAEPIYVTFVHQF